MMIIIAPYGHVGDVRDAADTIDSDLLGDGAPLEGGGRAWHLARGCSQDICEALKEAGADAFETDEPLSKALEGTDYSIKSVETTL